MHLTMEEEGVPDTVQFSLGQTHTGGVLLVARDGSAAKTVSRALGALCSKVVTVDSAVAALSEIRRTSFDAVFCDATLAGTGDVDLVATLRAYAPATPIALLSDSAMTPDRLAITLGRMRAVRGPAPSSRPTKPTVRRVSGVAQVGPRGTSFDDALESLFVDLEPVVDVQSGTTLGFAARLGSRVEKLHTHGALFECAHGLRRRTELLTQFFEVVTRAFVQAPENSLLFVEGVTADDLAAYLEPSGICPASLQDRVVLALSSFGDGDLETLRNRVDELRAAGYRIAISHDDAPEAEVTRPDFVTIGATAVRGLDRDPERLAAIRSAVTRLSDLGAVAIAQGVASAEEQAALRNAGCYLAQGPLHRRRALRSSLAPTVGRGLFEVRLRKVAGVSP
jgi:EAL domain-containing protein (putative c-di-GMP-specific phosphodiesterase class I)